MSTSVDHVVRDCVYPAKVTSAEAMKAIGSGRLASLPTTTTIEGDVEELQACVEQQLQRDAQGKIQINGRWVYCALHPYYKQVIQC